MYLTMPFPKFASGDNFCLGSGVPCCASLEESEEPSLLGCCLPTWEANASLNVVPMPQVNEHKVGRVQFHCSKARAHHGVICRGCWIPSLQGSGLSYQGEPVRSGREASVALAFVCLCFAVWLVSLASFHSGVKY